MGDESAEMTILKKKHELAMREKKKVIKKLKKELEVVKKELEEIKNDKHIALAMPLEAASPTLPTVEVPSAVPKKRKKASTGAGKPRAGDPPKPRGRPQSKHAKAASR